MMDERDEHHHDDEHGREPQPGLRLVPSPPIPKSSVANDSLREIIRQVQRPTKRSTPPSDDPPRAARALGMHLNQLNRA